MKTDALPIPARLRSDLQWSQYAVDCPDFWIAHDPVCNEYFFFSSIEKTIANCLDGNHSVDAIVQKLQHVDGFVSYNFIRDLILRLDQASLLLRRNWKQSPTLKAQLSNRWLTRLNTLIACRIPLFNPSRTVSALEPLGRILFNCWTLVGVVILLMVCALMLAHRWTEFNAGIWTLQTGMRGDRFLLAACFLFAIKGVHELGHALACRIAGADCREIGVLFFLGVPCLYCDVSDVWQVPYRWKRVMVSAGGIIVEIVISIVACLVWINSSTPWIQSISLQIMLLCSVVTVLINANPLLRYDGYYMLSDGLGVPNLEEQSREAWLKLWCIGLFGFARHRLTIKSISLAMYHVASSLYRCFLLSLMIWGVNRWLWQNRLSEFGAIFTLVLALAFLAIACRGIRPAGFVRQGKDPISWYRLGSWGVVLLISIWVLGTWRFPRYLFARGVIESGEMTQLYARHSAVVRDVLQQGVLAQVGDTLVATESPELELERLQTQGDLDVAKVRLLQASYRSVDDPLSAQQIAEQEKTVRAIEERISKLDSELYQLRIRATGAGRFAEAWTEQTKTDFAGRKYGQTVRLGAIARDRPFVERGQQVGELLLSGGWKIRTFVNEKEIDNCELGATVIVRLDQLPGVTIQGKVTSISAGSISRTPKSLVGDSLFASTIAETEPNVKPEQTSYAVMIELEVKNRLPIANGLASVQIETNSMTMFQRWWQMLSWETAM